MPAGNLPVVFEGRCFACGLPSNPFLDVLLFPEEFDLKTTTVLLVCLMEFVVAVWVLAVLLLDFQPSPCPGRAVVQQVGVQVLVRVSWGDK